MKFEPEKSAVSALVIFSMVSVLLTLQLRTLIYEPEAGYFLPLLPSLPVGLMLWIWFGTGYEIKNGNLYYRSGPFTGNIDISGIKEIRKGQSWRLIGIKPALSTDGIIIRYNKFDEIFLAPDNKKEFIEELLRNNPDIMLNLPPRS